MNANLLLAGMLPVAAKPAEQTPTRVDSAPRDSRFAETLDAALQGRERQPERPVSRAEAWRDMLHRGPVRTTADRQVNDTGAPRQTAGRANQAKTEATTATPEQPTALPAQAGQDPQSETVTGGPAAEPSFGTPAAQVDGNLNPVVDVALLALVTGLVAQGQASTGATLTPAAQPTQVTMSAASPVPVLETAPVAMPLAQAQLLVKAAQTAAAAVQAQPATAPALAPDVVQQVLPELAPVTVQAAGKGVPAPQGQPTFQDLIQLVQSQPDDAPAPGTQQTIDASSATLIIGGNAGITGGGLSGKGELQVTGQAVPTLRTVDPVAVAGQVSRAISVNLTPGASEVKLKLHPEHLGEMTLKLVVTGTTVQAQALVTNPAVQHALESQLSHLRQQLADSGLSLTSFGVAVGDQGGFSQAFQQSGQHGRQEWTPEPREEQAAGGAAPDARTPHRSPWSRLDTRA
jgi:flagellar hook-length control protein FliK